MTPDTASLAIVALGSNLGNPGRTVRETMDRLEARSAAPLRRSSLWQSAPLDCPPGSPWFVNAVVVLTPRSGETPESLLAHLQDLERESGRRPKEVLNEPRPLDLDLITWGSEIRKTPGLILPHPRAHLRRFVLAPLAEIATDLVLPGHTVSVRELLAGLPADGGIRRVSGSEL